MSLTIPFRIITPEKALFDQSVLQVTVPTESGEITVLPNHIPLITAVASGDVLVKTEKSEEPFTVVSGILVVEKNQITLLADFAEHVDDQTEELIQKAQARAIELQNQTISAEEGAYFRAELERSLARIKSHSKWKGKRRTSQN